MNVAGVVNKEREAEKGKSPLASPLKEKGEEKEISTVSVSDSARACAYAQGSASPKQSHLKAESEPVDIGNRVLRPDRRRLEKVDADFILYGFREDGTRNDPVQVAMVALKIPKQSGTRPNGTPYSNPGLFRYVIRIIGEECFRRLAYQQWRENTIDGEPNSRAAAFMAKLYAAKDELKGGAA